VKGIILFFVYDVYELCTIKQGILVHEKMPVLRGLMSFVYDVYEKNPINFKIIKYKIGKE